MNPSDTGSLTRALITAASFVALLVVVVAIARFKKVPLPFAPPRPASIALWLSVFLVAAVFQELVGPYISGGGEGSSSDWDVLTPSRMIRAATIVLLAPLAEEVAFRGTMYGSLVKQKLHPALTVLLPALAFTVIHFQYSGLGLGFIFIDGVIFGLARRHTNSLFVPVLLHTLGNAYAIYERMF